MAQSVDARNLEVMPTPTDELRIRVDFDGQGGWEVDVDDTRVACASLSDARRIAVLKAAHRRPCELVVRDAYHRVIEREHIGGPGEVSRRS
jgi:hypothetical protein